MENTKSKLIEKIIKEKSLRAVYQPIISLKDGTVHGYEALSRITDESVGINIAELFSIASEYGYLWELEKLCRTNALKYAKEKPKGTKLFINIDGNVLRDSSFQKGFTREKLNKYSIDINDVVLEITERSDFDDRDLLNSVMSHYREQGYKLALDDLGSGYSGLNRLQIIKPGYVKIDYELVHEIHMDKAKKSLVRLLASHCDDMGYKLIAEGIESEEELKCLINLGVEYGQGFFLRRPATDFKKIDKQIEKLILRYQRKKTEAKFQIGNISKMGSVLYSSCYIWHAKSLFITNNDLEYIVIVDKSCCFCGLLYREKAMQYGDYDSNTVESIMETNVMQIDADKSIKSTINKLIQRSEKTFYCPFVVLKKERYYGIITIKDLLIAIGNIL